MTFVETTARLTNEGVSAMLIAAIGIGSGSGEQDETVARAALAAIGAEAA